MGTYRALRDAERRRNERLAREALGAPLRARTCRVVTVANPKGGVGKTTLVANLAAYLRAQREDLPVLVLGLDGQDGLDRTLAREPSLGRDLLHALATGDLASTVRWGEFGVEYVPSPASREELTEALRRSRGLAALLADSGRDGVVLIDTGSELGPSVRAALEASDLAILPVRDLESLTQAQRLLSLGLPRERARFALCGLDLRVKFDAAECGDLLALLLYELRVRGLDHFATAISRSPAVEALATTPDGRRRTVLHGAPSSIVHRQLHALAGEVLEALEALPTLPTAAPGELVCVPAQGESFARFILSRS